MKKLDAFRQILADTVRTDMSLDEVLLYAVVLHTYRIELAPNVVLDDAYDAHPIVLSPLTRQSVAVVLASLWEGEAERGKDGFWFACYCERTPYEVMGDLPPELRQGVELAVRALEAHPMVAQLEED